jgi:hypothetical protein
MAATVTQIQRRQPMAAHRTSRLAEALLMIQIEAPRLGQDAVVHTPRRAYADLLSLLSQVLPHLQRHGVLLVQTPSDIDGAPALKTQFIHVASEESIEEVVPVVPDDSPNSRHAIELANCESLLSLLGLGESELRDRIRPPMAATA